jgi:tetratricopeptide (TPR) repeat protein
LSDHLTAGDVEHFLQGTFPQAKMKEALRHLFKGCEACEERLRPLLLLMAAPEAVPEDEASSSEGREYEAPISRALAAAMSRKPESRSADRELVARGLDILRKNANYVMVFTEAEAAEYWGGPIIEILIQLSFEERYRNPQEMRRLAILAQLAADNLHRESVYDPLVVADYQARAWAELGNAHRVNDDLNQAAGALGTATLRFEEGTGNMLLLARVVDLQASLLNDQRKIPDACYFLDMAAQLYQKVGDDHLAGRALVSKGIYMNYEGDPQGALNVLRQGFVLLDHDRDPQLLALATESVLWVMVQCGQFREAAALLMGSGLRQALAEETLGLVTIRWLEGQILVGLGKHDRAESAFMEARAGFLTHDKVYKAALVGLDLAGIWLYRGRKPEVRELAADMLQTFQKLGIQREGQRALEYLVWACDRERITPRLVGHVRSFLNRLEREPQLRFEVI